jgi:hypothetical protein
LPLLGSVPLSPQAASVSANVHIAAKIFLFIGNPPV